jgi:hypothetical protein
MHNACRRSATPILALLLILLLAFAGVVAAVAAPVATTPIRSTPANPVPACVTPERLREFLVSANPVLDPRFRDIAHWYKKHGEAWHVRWDYAFFQMALETNFLSFRRGDGRNGDVEPRQNNFAGIGTTGNGRPGDSFADVSTGVLAQIQHLVVYSGQRISDPVAPRTQLKQDDILAAIQRILARGPVTFQDLTGLWAADRSYGRAIESIAERYRALYCMGRPEPLEVATRASGPAPARAGPRPPEPGAAVRPPPAANPREQLAALARAAVEAPPPARPAPPAASPARCRVQAASYGGRKTLLIQAVTAGEEQFTALGVLEGFERSMAESFIRTHAPGGRPIAEFSSPDAALAKAFELCPSAARQ